MEFPAGWGKHNSPAETYLRLLASLSSIIQYHCPSSREWIFIPQRFNFLSAKFDQYYSTFRAIYQQFLFFPCFHMSKD